ncbi:MAG TPA: cytosine permease [Acidimicrobiales bacterium]|nr:cytosine permease [Acidimicrobiales bacterium]
MTAVAVRGSHLPTFERRSVGVVPASQRRGRPSSQFAMWFGANLTIADFALGFLPVALGMGWGPAVAAVVVGNVLGAAALGLAAGMGPSSGLPQMVQARLSFGSIGGRLPAALNWLSTLGWYSVNTILGAFGVQLLIPGTAFWLAALVLVAAQSVLGVVGHDLVQRFEQVMSVLLGVLFLVLSVDMAGRHRVLSGYHPASHGGAAAFAVVVAATLSYVGSWSPYGSDYSRYLPERTSPLAVGWFAAAGGFVASVWLELLGVAVAVAAGGASVGAEVAAHRVLGGLGGVAVAAIVLGAVAANAANLYSNSLSAAAIWSAPPRWVLAAVASAGGLIAAIASSGHFESRYEEFLLLIGYWFTPWLAVEVARFSGRRHGRHGPLVGARSTPATGMASDTRVPLVDTTAIAAFVVGVAAEVPFMSSALFTGPLARDLGGADLSFYVGFAAALAVAVAGGVGRRGAARPAG